MFVCFFIPSMDQANQMLASREFVLGRDTQALAEERLALDHDRALLDTVQQRLYEDATKQAKSRDDVEEKVC
jgi:hypothetical protein